MPNKNVRFIIEGEWSGYRSDPRRIVHRTVHPATSKKLRAWAEKDRSILYTDGTLLYLRVRYCKPRERIEEIHGYDSLIRDCQFYDVDSVNALQAKLREGGGDREAASSHLRDRNGFY